MTKLVANNRWVVQNDEGLLLNDVVNFLIKVFHSAMPGYGHLLHAISRRIASYKKNKSSYGYMSHLYPTFEDWVDHFERFDEVVNIWKEAMAGVDEIMLELPTWQPLLLLYEKCDPEIDFETYM